MRERPGHAGWLPPFEKVFGIMAFFFFLFLFFSFFGLAAI